MLFITKMMQNLKIRMDDFWIFGFVQSESDRSMSPQICDQYGNSRSLYVIINSIIIIS